MWQSAGIPELLTCTTDSISTMPRRRRCFPRRGRRCERGLDAWANPSSPHAEGRASRALLEEARATIAEALGWRHDVIFTSGASEAVEIAAAACAGRGASAWRDRARDRASCDGAGFEGHPGRSERSDRRSGARRGPRRRAGAGRDPAREQRDRRHPAARSAGAAHSRGGVAAARRLRAVAPASCRCPTPTSLPPARTSWAARRASACCW